MFLNNCMSRSPLSRMHAYLFDEKYKMGHAVSLGDTFILNNEP